MKPDTHCEISESRRDGVCILHLRGVLDGPGGLALDARISPLFRTGPARLVIDLHGLDNVASTGIGAIIACHRKAKAAGGLVVLAQPMGSVSEVITVLNLASLLPVAGTVAEGVQLAAAGAEP